MALTKSVYHWNVCAAEVLEAEMIRKLSTGGQGSDGPVYARKGHSVQVRNCDHCSEPIKLGEACVEVTVKTNASTAI